MIEVGKNLTCHSNFISILLQDQRQSQAHQVMSLHFWRISCCLRYLVRILLHVCGLWLHVLYCCCCLRPCFMQVLSTVCHVLLLLSLTMLRAGLVDSMSCIVVAVFNHASCRSCRQYVMYCCCCLVISGSCRQCVMLIFIHLLF